MPGFPKLPEGLEAKANTILSDVANSIGPLQADYQTQHGHYWQGLRTHGLLPKDGAAAAPDKSRKPSDQVEDWNAAGVSLPSTMVVAVQVDNYDGPSGQGYVVIAEVELAGRVWRRALGIGPEARSHDWQKVSLD